MKGRKPDPRRLRLLDGAGEAVSTQDLPAKGGKGRRPACPAWLSEGQRKAFASICRRLDREGILAAADEADIRALAIAEERLRVTTEFIEENGLTYEVMRSCKCPACKGSGVRSGGAVAAAKVPHLAPPKRAGLGRPCSICTHPEALAIAGALARGDTPGAISRAFRVGRDAVARHRTGHLAGGAAKVVAESNAASCPACGGTGVRESKASRVHQQYSEVTQQRDAIDRILRLSAELGLSPTSRVRVKGKMGGLPASGLQEFLKTRANRA